MRDAVELALEHIDHKMGPVDVEIVYADDEFNPQKGKQATERVISQDKVDIVFGYIWSMCYSRLPQPYWMRERF